MPKDIKGILGNIAQRIGGGIDSLPSRISRMVEPSEREETPRNVTTSDDIKKEVNQLNKSNASLSDSLKGILTYFSDDEEIKTELNTTIESLAQIPEDSPVTYLQLAETESTIMGRINSLFNILGQQANSETNLLKKANLMRIINKLENRRNDLTDVIDRRAKDIRVEQLKNAPTANRGTIPAPNLRIDPTQIKAKELITEPVVADDDLQNEILRRYQEDTGPFGREAQGDTEAGFENYRAAMGDQIRNEMLEKKRPSVTPPPNPDSVLERITDLFRTTQDTRTSDAGQAAAPGTEASQVPSQQPKRTHTVSKNETLGAIAKKHGTSVRALMGLNTNIKNPDRISVGQVINLPSATTTGTTSPSQPTSSATVAETRRAGTQTAEAVTPSVASASPPTVQRTTGINDLEEFTPLPAASPQSAPATSGPAPERTSRIDRSFSTQPQEQPAAPVIINQAPPQPQLQQQPATAPNEKTSVRHDSNSYERNMLMNLGRAFGYQ